MALAPLNDSQAQDSISSTGQSFCYGAYDIIIDNGASISITSDLGDFVGNPKPVNIPIIGASAASKATLMGTVKCCIEDDDGVVHDILIPNTVYSAGTSNKLLSPQHWTQEARDRYPNANGTWCATLDDRVILFWNQQKYKNSLLSPRDFKCWFNKECTQSHNVCKNLCQNGKGGLYTSHAISNQHSG
jgi:hypothetical protein